MSQAKTTHPSSATHGGANLALARVAIDAARKKADEIGIPMNVAIVDGGANLVAFERMDGAWLGSIRIAMDKAFTARAFDMSTKELGKLSQPEEPAFGIASTLHGHVVIFAGGLPLRGDGTAVIGGIGVSGGLPSQDEEVAAAGAEAYRLAVTAQPRAKAA